MGKTTSRVFDLALIPFDQQPGPAELPSQHGSVAAGPTAPELDEALRRRADLLEESPQDAVFLILREEPETARRQTVGVRQRRVHEDRQH